jgi:hypothetical protein
MRRIAIIDHSTHTLMVEDINGEILEGQYGGDEQKYIDDNYTFEGEYSWNWITDTKYFPEGYSTPIEIDFKEEVPKEILEWDEENKKINLEF